jgi:hypothetical protein
VLYGILSGRLRPEQFDVGDDPQAPVLLQAEARRQFVTDLHAKLRSSLIHPVAKTRMDYHRAMLWQVNHYRQVVEGRLAVYQPFLMR